MPAVTAAVIAPNVRADISGNQRIEDGVDHRVDGPGGQSCYGDDRQDHGEWNLRGHTATRRQTGAGEHQQEHPS